MKRLLPLFLLLGCSEAKPKEFHLDRELKPYYEDFLLEAKKRNHAVETERLGFVSLVSGERYLGKCIYGEGVLVNKSKTQMDPCTLRVVIFHELGHCLLDLPHNDEPGAVHIMQKKFEPSCAIYLYLWEELLDELFEPNTR